jgi:polyhydroxybutyrate depolymerase
VPASAERGGSVPLLILLHGSGSSGRGLEGYLHLGAAASAGGFLVAEPDGTRDRDGKRFWDATDACCDFDRTGVDDSTYLRDVIAAVRSAAPVDPKRIFVLGFSNGGFMSYRLACDHADLIAAIVSISGATFGTSSACRPSEPVAVLEIHGTADGSVAYGGGRIAGVGSPGHPPASYPGARATATDWATYDGCVTDATELPGRVDVDRRITAPSGGTAEATREVWQACRPGGAVELWTIPGGGHAPAVSTGFAGETLGFLEAHPKP